MRIILSTFFILIFQVTTLAQNRELDSIISVNEEKAPLVVAEDLRLKGLSYKREGNYDKAEEYYSYALEIFRSQKDSASIAKCYNNIALLNKNTGDFNQTLKYFYLAIEVNSKIGQIDELIKNFVNLANYYFYSAGSYKKALEYYLQAEKLMYQEEIKKNLGYLQLNIANLLAKDDYENRDVEQAQSYYLKALEIFQNQDDKYGISLVHTNIGVLYETQSKNLLALSSYKKSYKLKSEINDQRGSLINLLNIGNIHLKLKTYDSAISYYEKALVLSEELEDQNNHLNILTNLVKAKMAIGQVEEASNLFNTYNLLRDSVFNQDKMQEIKELETRYETEKKERELAQQRLVTAEKDRQSKIFLTLSIALILMIVITLVFFRQKQTYLKKLKNEEIASLKTEQELKELNAMIHGQEEERNRIATDIHDRLGARLSSIKLLFEQGDDIINHDKLLAFINEAIKEAREISHNLSTDMLTRFGIVTAIEDLVSSINLSNQIVGDFTTSGIHERLPLTIERNLYHIILELVNNTIKHAEAESFFIQISKFEDELNVFYEDDGKGFNVDDHKNKGMGLRNLHARTSTINGNISINSSPGNGLNIVINIPLKVEKLLHKDLI